MKRRFKLLVLGALLTALTVVVIVLGLKLSRTSSELVALRSQPLWTDAHETALAVYSGNDRVHSAFKVLCRGPSTRFHLSGQTPAGLDNVDGVIEMLKRIRIAQAVPGTVDMYETTAWGRRVCSAYDEIPEHLKIYAGCYVWKVINCPAPPPRYTTTPPAPG